MSDLHQALYRPGTWANFSSGEFYDFYQEIVQGSGSNLTLATRSMSIQNWPTYTSQAISCGDSIDESDITTRAVFDEFIRVVKDVSPMCERTCCVQILQHPSHHPRSVGIQFPQPCHFCHRWPVRAVERFTGPWNGTLKNPIVIIGNKADPATPFVDASLVAGWLGDSAMLVEQDGFGHVSLAQKSTCTQKIIFDFFVNGIRPAHNDTVCDIDADGPELFPSVKASGIKNAILSDDNADSPDSKEGDRIFWGFMGVIISIVGILGFIHVLVLCFGCGCCWAVCDALGDCRRCLLGRALARRHHDPDVEGYSENGEGDNGT